MAETVLSGVPAAPGAGAGPARVLAGAAGGPERPAPAAGGDELVLARSSLAAARASLEATAARLRADGRRAEAEIVEAGALMAADPALDASVAARVADGRAAVAALLEAAEDHAARIAALPDETLAARAADVRSLGRRAARLATGAPALGTAAGCVVVADDLGPADVAELDEDVAAIALAAGGPTAHAAIVARSLGIPMAVGLGPRVLDVREGDVVAVDGDLGEVALAPSPQRVAEARAAARARHVPAADRDAPAITTDGERVRVLVNVAGPAEVRVGLLAGAEGIGLLRTELAFLEASAWPTAAEHHRLLAPVLEALGPGLPAVVRVLDFGADKTPPFLAGAAQRGIALLLAAPDALRAQLAALDDADGDVRVLLPLVEDPAQVEAVRALTTRPVGAMVETPVAVAAAPALAAAADFLSIGTNDLSAETLGADRFRSGAAPAHHPAVLRHIAATVAAAGRTPLEVCGEAASDPIALPLLVGLGVRDVSVGAARVAAVRRWVRELSAARCAALARRALECSDAAEVEALVVQLRDAPGEGGDRLGRVGALGAQH
jgi:phosphoenolpyruvate-protein kinase (PTS system EI component)